MGKPSDDNERMPPAVQVERPGEGDTVAHLRGSWCSQDLRRVAAPLRAQLADLAADGALRWNLAAVDAMDHLGALLLWRAWGHRLPASVDLPVALAELFTRLEAAPEQPPATRRGIRLLDPVRHLGETVMDGAAAATGMVRLLGQLQLDGVDLLRHPERWPWLELSAGLYRIGAQALGITALVGFLIGVVLGYLTADQLRPFGADVYLVNLLGISTVRELGPLLAAILVAGRSGSAMTAQLGVMRLNEELDALTVIGVRASQRLVLPRVLALTIALPLVALWTTALVLLGGMVAARFRLGLSLDFFLHRLPDVVSIGNYWIGLGKGAVFGLIVGMVASYFGLQIEPNTESLGAGTTRSVVVGITCVILADAVFAITCSMLGI